jgi:divalent metal cation (Fe/Co/Zn/Cd) transporter
MAIGLFDSSMIPFVSTFLFVFAVVYGLLSVAKIIKGPRVNAVIAFAIAGLSATQQVLVDAMQTIMLPFAAVLVVLFIIVLIKKIIFGDDKGKKKDIFPIVVTLALLLIVVGVFWNSIAAYLPAGMDSTTVLWIVGIVIVIAIFVGVYKYEPNKKERTG